MKHADPEARSHVSRASANPAEQNIRAVARLEEKSRSKRTTGACISDAITDFAGSGLSVLLHAIWFAVWLAVNLGLTPFKPFDPFPFSLLTSIVSLEAIFLSLFVLASQNHLTKEADKRAHLDLQVNMLAEQEMTVVLHMLKELCDRFDLNETTSSDEFKALLKHTDIKNLADRLEKTILPMESESSADAKKHTEQADEDEDEDDDDASDMNAGDASIDEGEEDEEKAQPAEARGGTPRRRRSSAIHKAPMARKGTR